MKNGVLINDKFAPLEPKFHFKGLSKFNSNIFTLEYSFTLAQVELILELTFGI
jgi:hypothetical protein